MAVVIILMFLDYHAGVPPLVFIRNFSIFGMINALHCLFSHTPFDPRALRNCLVISSLRCILNLTLIYQ